jgi:hypothetical protein
METNEINQIFHSDDPESTKARNEIKNCPCCDRIVEDQTVTYSAELFEDLHKVFKWCEQKGKFQFYMRDIREIIRTSNYGTFAHLTYAGGLVYRPEIGADGPKKGLYGINRERTEQFFRQLHRVPVWIRYNPITGKTLETKYDTLENMPKLREYMTERGDFDPTARPTPPTATPKPNWPGVHDISPGQFEVEGSGGKRYKVTNTHGKLTCECEAFRWSGRKQECKHTKEVARLIKLRLEHEFKHTQKTLFN